MRLSARHQMLGLLVVVLVASTGAAPLPAPSPQVNAKENSIEAYEDGLLIFVPTIPAADKDKSGKDLKREVEYELIAIPGEILRREIRQIAQQYQLPSISSIGPQLVVESDSVHDFGEIIIPSAPSNSYGKPQVSISTSITKPSISVPSIPVPSKPVFSLPSTPGLSIPIPTINFGVSNKPNFGDVISDVTGYASGAGETLVEVGEAGSKFLGQVGVAAASGGGTLARWLLDQKSQGVSTATQVVGGGLQYAGQLSAGVLRVLLQVPGIKARVLAEIIEAGQPLVYAISDVIAESADDLGDHFESKTSILAEAVGIIIRLVQDALSLKGRIIFSLGASGLDIGATAFNAGVKIGGAFVETATGVGGAVVSGVSDIVKVGKSIDLPPLPALPPIVLPQLPTFDTPNIQLPIVNLGRLIPPKSLLSPIPLPDVPQISFTNVDLIKPQVSIPTVSVSKPNIVISQPQPNIVISQPKPNIVFSQPTQLYGNPGR